jgi:hypothetical protein
VPATARCWGTLTEALPQSCILCSCSPGIGDKIHGEATRRAAEPSLFAISRLTDEPCGLVRSLTGEAWSRIGPPLIGLWLQEWAAVWHALAPPRDGSTPRCGSVGDGSTPRCGSVGLQGLSALEYWPMPARFCGGGAPKAGGLSGHS